MALSIKDGAGSSTNLKTDIVGGEHTPHHVVDQVSGTVTVSGTVHVNSTTPVNITGAATVTVLNSSLKVTSSKGEPLFVISDTDKPVVVSNTAATPLYVTSSATYPFYVTASHVNPIAITGTVLALSDSPNYTDSSPIVSRFPSGSSSAKNGYSIGYGIDYSNSTSGTFALAAADSSRKGLIIANPSNRDLYVTIGSGALNGFTLKANTSDEPASYSFILYANGTYFAESPVIQMFHGGFFVSASNILSLEPRALVTIIG